MRRIGAEHSATRAVLLDATAQLMVEEGYAAVSTRQVAKRVGLTPALVHYYFPTTDDLLLAVYRRATEQLDARIVEALASNNPLRALWTLSIDSQRTTLGVEFMAMANHRKAIRTEMARHIERTRKVEADAMSALVASAGDDAQQCSSIGLMMLIAAISRALVMEETLGITSGHAEGRAFMESWLDRLEKPKRARSPKKRVASARPRRR